MIDLESYLRQESERRMRSWKEPEGYLYFGPEDLVRSEGRLFKSIQPKPRDTDEVLRVLREKQRDWDEFGNSQHCYENALWLAEYDKRFEYVEGYAKVDEPVLHAWTLFESRLVVDPTWKVDDEVDEIEFSTIGAIPEGREYYGIVFPIQLVRKLAPALARFGGFIDMPGRGWPLCKTGVRLLSHSMK